MTDEIKNFSLETCIETFESVFREGKPRNEYDLMMFTEHKLLDDFNVTTQYPGVDLNDDSRESRINMIVWNKSSNRINNAYAFEVIYKVSEGLDRYQEPINDNGADTKMVCDNVSEMLEFIEKFKPTSSTAETKIANGYVIYLTDSTEYIEQVLDALLEENKILEINKESILSKVYFYQSERPRRYYLCYTLYNSWNEDEKKSKTKWSINIYSD